MNRILVFVVFSITVIEIHHASDPANNPNKEIASYEEEEKKSLVKPYEEEKRSLVQPYDVEQRDTFTQLFAPDSNHKLQKKVNRKDPKKSKTKKGTKKPNKQKTTPKPNNNKKKKWKNNKQGSFRIIIENNVINIQPGQRFIIESNVDDEYDDESLEEIKDNTKDCPSCGRGTYVDWRPFNPPLWPFNN